MKSRKAITRVLTFALLSTLSGICAQSASATPSCISSTSDYTVTGPVNGDCIIMVTGVGSTISIQLPTYVTNIAYELLGGGGAGGKNRGGGGGAGGYLYQSNETITTINLSVVVGAGGVGGAAPGNGGDSFIDFDNSGAVRVTAGGGGAGGSPAFTDGGVSGNSVSGLGVGGSGGGAAMNFSGNWPYPSYFTSGGGNFVDSPGTRGTSSSCPFTICSSNDGGSRVMYSPGVIDYRETTGGGGAGGTAPTVEYSTNPLNHVYPNGGDGVLMQLLPLAVGAGGGGSDGRYVRGDFSGSDHYCESAESSYISSNGSGVGGKVNGVAVGGNGQTLGDWIDPPTNFSCTGTALATSPILTPGGGYGSGGGGGDQQASADGSQGLVLIKYHAKSSQNLLIANAPTNETVGNTSTLTVSSDSGLTPTLIVDPSSGGICSLNSTTVTYLSPGVCTINADQGGNNDYQSATQIQFSINISAPPANVNFPEPVQVDTITSTAALTKEDSHAEVTVNGDFSRPIENITVNNDPLPLSDWVQAPTSVTIEIPPTYAGPVAIQIYNGASPVLPTVFFNLDNVAKKAVAIPVSTPAPIQTPSPAPTATPAPMPSSSPTPTVSPSATPSPASVKTSIAQVAIGFGNTVTEISSSGLATLKKILANKPSSIFIAGYASPTSKKHSDDLRYAQQRATTVANYFHTSAPTVSIGSTSRGTTHDDLCNSLQNRCVVIKYWYQN